MASSPKEAFASLAVAQAVYKAVAGAVSTKDGSSLRAQCDRALADMYDVAGTDRVRLTVNGAEVGTLSVRYSKAAEGAEVTDEQAFEDWCAERYPVSYETHFDRLTPEQQRQVAEMMREMSPGSAVPCHEMPERDRAQLRQGPESEVITPDGEVVDGMRWVSRPKAPVGTTIRGCEPEQVAEALHGQLPQVVAGLLSGWEVG